MPAKKSPVTLEQIFQKLIDHDKRFDDIEKRLDGGDKRLDGIDKRLDKHDDQFSNLAKQMFAFEDSFKKDIQRLDVRITAIDKNLEKFTGDFEALTQEYHMITAALKRIESVIGDTKQWPVSARSEMDMLKDRVSAIEERLLAVESR